MDCRPPRLTGIALGLLFLALALGGAALGLAQISGAAASALLVLWTVLPLAGVPLALVVSYHLFGLLTARYAVDRDSFRLRWGWAEEVSPLADTVLGPVPDSLRDQLRPKRGLWWPGCLVGQGEFPGIGVVEFFATRADRDLLLVSTRNRTLAISPPDVAAFTEAFVSATRFGSLRKVGSRSVRAEFFSARIWQDRTARVLILLGLILPLGLLGYLGAVAGSLPDLVPFGFEAGGLPEIRVPPSRLLFLPLIAVLCWLVDLILASVLFRNDRDKPLAYGAWGLAVVVAILLWGAALQLLAAA
jgi:hypothetical protein